MDDKQLQVLIGMFNQITSKIDHLEEIVSKRNDDVFTKMDAVYGEVIFSKASTSCTSNKPQSDR